MIDFIFYDSENLSLVSRENIPSKEIIGPNGLPN